jgi:regulator of protease activity HflC (stomatin/prohibitin superfamily)
MNKNSKLQIENRNTMNRYRFMPFVFFGICFATCITSCAVVRQDEVAVRRRFGKLTPKVLQPGLYMVNPFFAKLMKIPIRTLNMQIMLEALPSKEGFTIEVELAILYHVKGEQAVQILKDVGKVKYGEQIIMSVLRSATADITSKFYAKDMHTSERENIEREIAAKMMQILGDRGFVIENVLLKSIRLPSGLAASIESKLRAEQEAIEAKMRAEQEVERMKFTLEKERQEAERKRIEAEGIRDAQKIIAEGLNPILIQYKSLDVMQKLSLSPNTKIIITDGKTPYLINSNGKE